jgi:hypothetical protein
MSEQTLKNLMQSASTDKSILGIDDVLTRYLTYRPQTVVAPVLPPERLFPGETAGVHPCPHGSRPYTKFTINRSYADMLTGKTPYPRVPPGFQTNHYPTHIGTDEIQWEDRRTCYMSLNEQCGPVWKALRECRIPASRSSAAAERSSFESDKVMESLAMEFCGLSKKSFDVGSIILTHQGVTGEPIVKSWIASELKVKIFDVGVAIWKADPRFCASLDGDIDDDTFCEVKIPGKGIYRKLIEHMEAVKKGFTPPPGYHQHMYNSHYDQITQSGIITGKKRCIYAVANLEKKEYYTESISINQHHWDHVLYPKGVAFYEKHMEPLMVRTGLRRVDPWQLKTSSPTEKEISVVTQ